MTDHTAPDAGLRAALKDAIRILSGGHRGYVGDHYIREVQVNEATIERLRAALASPAPAGLDVERLHHSSRCPEKWRCRLPLRGQRDATHVSYSTEEERQRDIAAHYEIYSGTAEQLAALASPAPPGLDEKRCAQCVQWRHEYNAAVANGLIETARRIDRRIAAHERDHRAATRPAEIAKGATPLMAEEALKRLASWDEMAGNGDPADFPPLYRQEIAARINLARAALASGLDVERLRWGQCGDDLLPSEIEGHLASEGRAATRPAGGE